MNHSRIAADCVALRCQTPLSRRREVLKDDAGADRSMVQKAKDAVGVDKSKAQEAKDAVGVDRSAAQKAQDASN